MLNTTLKLFILVCPNKGHSLVPRNLKSEFHFMDPTSLAEYPFRAIVPPDLFSIYVLINKTLTEDFLLCNNEKKKKKSFYF